MNSSKPGIYDHAPITNAICVYHDVDLDGRCGSCPIGDYACELA